MLNRLYTNNEIKPSYKLLLLICSLLIYCVFSRVFFLNIFPGLETDEGWWSIPAKNYILNGDWTFSGMPHFFHSPVFSFLTAFVFKIFGIGSVQARMISIIFGLFTIYFVFLIGRKLYNDKLGLLASFFYGINAYVINISRKAFVESVQLFFIIVAFYIWIGTSGRKRLFSGIFFGLALLTKINVIYMVFPFIIWEVLRLYHEYSYIEKIKRIFSYNFFKNISWFLFPAAILFLSVNFLIFIMDAENFVYSYQRIAVSKYYFSPSTIFNSLKYMIITAPFIFTFSILMVCFSIYKKALSRERMTIIVWFVFSLFWLLIVSGYQPNRFFFPIYPVMAIISADFLLNIRFFLQRRLVKFGSIFTRYNNLLIMILIIALFQSSSLVIRFIKYNSDTVSKVSQYIISNIDKSERIFGYAYCCLDIPNESIDMYASKCSLFRSSDVDSIIQEYEIRYILFDTKLSKLWFHPQIRNYLLKNAKIMKNIDGMEIWKVNDDV